MWIISVAITKKIKFPVIISSLSFSYFCTSLAANCPEYDEIVESYITLPSIFDDIIKVIKKLSFYKLENELVFDLKNRFKILTIFENK